jgi:pyridoxal phosphate enzyme (YggS family)
LTTIAQRYHKLRAEVPAHVTIVAVSKFQPPEAIAEAMAAGVRDFGENYAQEAVRKFADPGLAAASLTKHFIGHVQTNKAKAIAAAFDVVQSVDRPQAADALAKAAAELGKTLAVFLQVNISPAERFGCAPAHATELAAHIRGLEHLRLDGVMAIGPVTGDRPAVLQAFGLAAKAREETGVSALSIGMSGDWPDAVAAGSTMIRIGTGIFGPRPARRTSNA